MRIFAVALSYGVMVAQQVLVLFVVVRIRLGQREGRQLQCGVAFFRFRPLSRRARCRRRLTAI